MQRGPAKLAIGLVAVLAASALTAVLVLAWRGGDETTQRQVEPSSAIEAQASFTPRLLLFGDTVRAHVDLMLDTERVDPDSVRIAADFSPFEVVRRPERRIVSAGEQAHVRTTFVLRCVTAACAQSGQSARYEFTPGRITFSDSGRRPPAEDAIRVPLPTLRVYSRFTASDLEDSGRTSTPWEADLSTFPAPSYRFAPALLVALLVAGSALAALGALALAYAAWPRREVLPPVTEPEAAPELVLSPLEQALALLEEAVRVNGAADQRRALELVAEELELAEWGDPDLARAARALAWSKDVPPVEKTSGLAARVRSVLPEIEDTLEDNDDRENGDVRVE
jgi:hypothetical protein